MSNTLDNKKNISMCLAEEHSPSLVVVHKHSLERSRAEVLNRNPIAGDGGFIDEPIVSSYTVNHSAPKKS